MRVTVIDYGLSNLLSVRRAVENLGYEPVLATSADALREARVLILPGVGAFGDGMARLCALGLAQALQSRAAAGVPLLGICLGMQMLFETSYEFGQYRGLGLIPGQVARIPGKDKSGLPQLVPHMGWQPLLPPQKTASMQFMAPFAHKGEEVYFVHSYEANPQDPGHTLAECSYGGRRICAAVGYGNIYGTQFHPEKSGPVGLAVLDAFLKQAGTSL